MVVKPAAAFGCPYEDMTPSLGKPLPLFPPRTRGPPVTKAAPACNLFV